MIQQINSSIKPDSNYRMSPPNNIDMEKSLLCCLLMDSEGYEKISHLGIISDVFYYKANSLIFTAYIRLQGEVESYDMLTVSNKLKEMGSLSEAGGINYILDIIDTVSTSANIVYFAEAIKDMYMKREIISSSTVAIEVSYQDTESGEDILDKVSSDLFALSDKQSSTHPQSLGSLVMDTYNEIEELSKSDKEISGITSGYESIDLMMNGWQPQTLTILASRPAAGKSLLSLNFAIAAAKAGNATAVFSLEMGKRELMKRLFSSEGGIPLHRLKTGNIEDEYFKDGWTKMTTVMNKLSSLPVYIDDSESLTMLNLRTKCRKMKKEKDLKFVIVDYLGLMDYDKGLERHEGISRITRGLKKLSKELDIPILLLAQLNREVDKRPDKRPLLSDLRDSGSTEQDADNIMFILRPEVYEKTLDNEGKVILIIAKQRSGPIGDVLLKFNKENIKFEEPEVY